MSETAQEWKEYQVVYFDSDGERDAVDIIALNKEHAIQYAKEYHGFENIIDAYLTNEG